MMLLSALMTLLLAAPPAEKPVLVVGAPDAPVRIDRATLLTPAEGPPVLLYSATNSTGDEIDQFTVQAFVFEADGTLKARQMAPARRGLDARGTKYSTLVLDGSAIAPTYIVAVGVNQVQRVGSESWWRTELEPLAVAAAKQAAQKK